MILNSHKQHPENQLLKWIWGGNTGTYRCLLVLGWEPHTRPCPGLPSLSSLSLWHKPIAACDIFSVPQRSFPLCLYFMSSAGFHELQSIWLFFLSLWRALWDFNYYCLLLLCFNCVLRPLCTLEWAIYKKHYFYYNYYLYSFLTSFTSPPLPLYSFTGPDDIPLCLLISQTSRTLFSVFPLDYNALLFFF